MDSMRLLAGEQREQKKDMLGSMGRYEKTKIHGRFGF
jgi:hypothetical protein